MRLTSLVSEHGLKLENIGLFVRVSELLQYIACSLGVLHADFEFILSIKLLFHGKLNATFRELFPHELVVFLHSEIFSPIYEIKSERSDAIECLT